MKLPDEMMASYHRCMPIHGMETLNSLQDPVLIITGV